MYVNMFNYAAKLVLLTWTSMGIFYVLESEPSAQLGNSNKTYFLDELQSGSGMVAVWKSPARWNESTFCKGLLDVV